MEAIYKSTENSAGFPVRKEWCNPSFTIISKKIVKNGAGSGNETQSTGAWTSGSGGPHSGIDYEGFSSANSHGGPGPKANG